MKLFLHLRTLPSLRVRLLLLLLSATLLLWSIAAVLSYFEARHEIEELFDAQLTYTAHILLAQAKHPSDEVEVDFGTNAHKGDRKIAFQIWGRDGRLVLHSANAPDQPFVESKEGFVNVSMGRKKWRVLSHWDEKHSLLVQVGERQDERDELIEDVVSRLLYPLLYAFPLLAALVWLSVGKGLAPLRGITAEVASRAPHQLSPLEGKGAPDEIKPLVDALNRLLSRLDAALENERRFTADAAHELRTPLAALKTQAQVAQRATDLNESRHALRQVVDGVDRATHLVEQLLTLARLEPGAVPPRMENLALRALAVECAAALAPQAMQKSIEISVEEGEAAIVGNVSMLGILLRNLVDNAIRYTPRGGWVSINVLRENAHVVLEVCDSGAGIPPEERDEVIRRFYRVLGSGEDGSGLGLSIVQRIAEFHGAAVELGESSAGGLSVRVSFTRPENAILRNEPSHET